LQLLVVAYAIAGTLDINLATDVIAVDKDSNDVYLKDLWPTTQEVAELVEQTVTREAFQTKYADAFKGDEKWQAVETTDALTYDWPTASTYVQNPPYFQGMGSEPGKISNIDDAKVLALLGDIITTDHISPAGSFKADTPAGQYLVDRQVSPREFNSYGSRRGNYEVMMLGTFATFASKTKCSTELKADTPKAQTAIKRPSMTPQWRTKQLALRWLSLAANGTARDHRVTGLLRVLHCWVLRLSSLRALNASTVPT
jgi:aconitate hydratase